MPTDTLPPLPTTVFSILGPVPVIVTDDIGGEDDEFIFGRWVPEERCIKLRAGVHALTQHVTLWHEVIHMVVWDAGTGLDKDAEERVCDGLSAFLFAAGVRL